MDTTTIQNNSDSSIAQSDEKIKASERKAEIVYIPIEKLHPHGDNPRKDVGDITELAESIKANGILQNLTVVPATGYWYGDYIVIIGHRRLAGAKKAGLSEVPCIIREMTEKEQIATMLLENMQRSDLTVYEQAQGMQMMLDLGETVESISEKTGFSETTVRRRVRIATLDGDKVREAQGRQINITEFDKLFEIEDADKRNKLLDEIGTSNFNWSLRRAKEDEQQEKNQSEIIKELYGKADEISDDNTKGLQWETSVNSIEDIPEFMADVNYYYKIGYNGYVYIYRDYTEEEKAEQDEANQKAETEREERAEHERKFEELFKQAFEMRMEFIKKFKNFKGKEQIVCEMALNALITANTSWHNEFNINVFNMVMGTQFDGSLSFNEIKDNADISMKTLLALSYSIFENGNEDEAYYDYYFRYCENEDLDTVYEYLVKLGYEMSDEEKALRDGTHELYIPAEEDEELDDEVDETDDIDGEAEQEPEGE